MGEAIGHAGAAIGILGTNGVVLAAEMKNTSSKLESDKTSEKMYMIDQHIACAVAGIRADANILINNARLTAQRHLFKYDEPMPVEQLIQQICDLKQGYTQFGGRWSTWTWLPFVDMLCGRDAAFRCVLFVRRVRQALRLPAVPERSIWQLWGLESHSHRGEPLISAEHLKAGLQGGSQPGWCPAARDQGAQQDHGQHTADPRQTGVRHTVGCWI